MSLVSFEGMLALRRILFIQCIEPFVEHQEEVATMFSHPSTFEHLVFILVTLKLHILFLVVSDYVGRFTCFLDLSVFLYVPHTIPKYHAKILEFRV
jgi:hypothetical protein